LTRVRPRQNQRYRNWNSRDPTAAANCRVTDFTKPIASVNVES
jgi:hypothetical protein